MRMNSLALPPANPVSRRRFVQQLTAGTFALGAGTTTYSAGWERRRPVLVRSSLPCPHLSPSQHGFKVLHLSDLHVDDWTPAITLQRAVRLAQLAQPDLIVFTGDFITSRPELFLRAARALTDLKAPHGLFACLGNHDVWNGRRRIADDLQQLGIRTLVNESIRLQIPGGPLWITGLDSAWAGRPDPKSALRHWNPAEPNLILLHEPDAADRLAEQNLAAVQLAGHTHGGQVRAPFIGAIETPHLGHKYILGYHRVGDLHLHVNPGLGTMGVPFRFLCPPELTLHTLVPA
jgi:predicted MPP superfamily phosphohydrolase